MAKSVKSAKPAPKAASKPAAKVAAKPAPAKVVAAAPAPAKPVAPKEFSVKPLHDRVIIKPAAAEEKTAGGIIIPDTAKEKPQRGIVVAAGPGKTDEPVTVKAGDTVLYGKYAGTEISIEGIEYLIMRESDILAIV